MLTDKKKNLEAVDDTVRCYNRKLDLAKKALVVVEDDYKGFLLNWKRKAQRLK